MILFLARLLTRKEGKQIMIKKIINTSWMMTGRLETLAKLEENMIYIKKITKKENMIENMPNTEEEKEETRQETDIIEAEVALHQKENQEDGNIKINVMEEEMKEGIENIIDSFCLFLLNSCI